MEKEYEQARRKVKDLKDFYNHLFAYILVNVTLFIINLISTPGIWWFYWVTIFWGIGLLWHAFGFLNENKFLGKEWEDKKIEEYMKKGKNN
ncbi:MAG: histidine kinase [Methanobacterium sp.]|nr:MAG: histidine kinase [Methanobacterium sp.]